MDETALPDGRRAQLWTGAASGAPVLVCHEPRTRAGWPAPPECGWPAHPRLGRPLRGHHRPDHLWYGAHDDRDPPAYGTWWADHIGGADLTISPGFGRGLGHPDRAPACSSRMAQASGEEARSADEPDATPHPW